MSRKKARIDSIPEGVQAIVSQARDDLVSRTGLDPEIVAVTKLERLERIPGPEESPMYSAGFGQDTSADYRIFFLAKGIQYVYETRHGKSPQLTEEKFVV